MHCHCQLQVRFLKALDIRSQHESVGSKLGMDRAVSRLFSCLLQWLSYSFGMSPSKSPTTSVSHRVIPVTLTLLSFSFLLKTLVSAYGPCPNNLISLF